jgi:kinetochore protein NDC80
MNNSIRTLIKYLTEHNFDHAISPKILTRPSNKDFNNIVMFLFRQIDPNLVFSAKFEDEVVAMFKQLGYPNQLSKTNISAAGTPHAWPSLLAALVWLIELLNYDEEASNGQYDAEYDDATSDKAFYKYLGNAYSLYLAGEDDRFADLEKQFIAAFESKNVLLKDHIHEIENRNLRLSSDIEEIEKRRAYLPELGLKKKDYLRDLERFEQLIEQLRSHKDQVKQKVITRRSEVEKLKQSIDVIEADIVRLKDQISKQEISPEDVKRMINQREQLESSLQQTSENRQALQRKVWEQEMNLRDKLQSLDDSARAFNSLGEELKLIPETATNARGKRLMIEVDMKAKKRELLLKTNIRTDILPALQDLKSDLNEGNIAIREDIVTEQDTLEEIESAITQQKDHYNHLENKIRRLDDTYKREKDSYDQLLMMYTTEFDTMETRLNRLRDTTQDESKLNSIYRKIDEMRSLLLLKTKEHHIRKRETVESVMDVVAKCASHKENLQQQLADVRKLYSQRLENHLLGKGIGMTINAALNHDHHDAYDHQDHIMKPQKNMPATPTRSVSPSTFAITKPVITSTTKNHHTLSYENECKEFSRPLLQSRQILTSQDDFTLNRPSYGFHPVTEEVSESN